MTVTMRSCSYPARDSIQIMKVLQRFLSENSPLLLLLLQLPSARIALTRVARAECRTSARASARALQRPARPRRRCLYTCTLRSLPPPPPPSLPAPLPTRLSRASPCAASTPARRRSLTRGRCPEDGAQTSWSGRAMSTARARAWRAAGRGPCTRTGAFRSPPFAHTYLLYDVNYCSALGARCAIRAALREPGLGTASSRRCLRSNPPALRLAYANMSACNDTPGGSQCRLIKFSPGSRPGGGCPA